MEETVVLPKHIAEFLYKVYFDFSEGNIMAAIKRAYRDMNRTLKGFPQDDDEKKTFRNNWNNVLKREIETVVLKEKFNNWHDYTKWHKKVCQNLRGANLEYQKLTFGQAQKWLNMTLKYLYVLGEERVPGSSLNYEFFHVPIDNIIQEEILKDLKIKDKKRFDTWYPPDQVHIFPVSLCL